MSGSRWAPTLGDPVVTALTSGSVSSCRCPTSPTPTCCRWAPTTPSTACSPARRQHLSTPGRAHVPPGRARGPHHPHRRGDARHRALPAPGAPARSCAAIIDDPEASANDRFVALDLLQQREHRGRRRAADVPGHRHRDRDGQARPSTCSPTGDDERGDRPRRLRRVHQAEPALLAARAADHVGREEHRHQPAGADRAVRRRAASRATSSCSWPRAAARPTSRSCTRRRRRVLNPTRHDCSSWRRSCARSARRPARRTTWRSSSAARQRRVRAEDREVRLRALPRQPADRRLAARPRRSATSSWSSRCWS